MEKNKEVKKVVSYNVTEKLVNDFIVISSIKKDKMSDIIEQAIYDYIIKNKAEVNNYILGINKNN